MLHPVIAVFALTLFAARGAAAQGAMVAKPERAAAVARLTLSSEVLHGAPIYFTVKTGGPQSADRVLCTDAQLAVPSTRTPVDCGTVSTGQQLSISGAGAEIDQCANAPATAAPCGASYPAALCEQSRRARPPSTRGCRYVGGFRFTTTAQVPPVGSGKSVRLSLVRSAAGGFEMQWR